MYVYHLLVYCHSQRKRRCQIRQPDADTQTPNAAAKCQCHSTLTLALAFEIQSALKFRYSHVSGTQFRTKMWPLSHIYYTLKTRKQQQKHKKKTKTNRQRRTRLFNDLAAAFASALSFLSNALPALTIFLAGTSMDCSSSLYDSTGKPRATPMNPLNALP